MKNYKIYTLAHPITLEVVYVGQTSLELNDRLAAHHSASLRRSTRIYEWMQNLRRDGLAPTIQLVEEVLKEDINNSEKHWIAKYRSEGVNLLNVTDGGKGPTGSKHTKETKEKLKHQNIGKTLSDETKAKMSASTKNKIGGMDTKVIDEDTGIVYKTIRECADALGMNKSTLRLRINNNQGSVKRLEEAKFREPKERVREHKNPVIDTTTGITYESGKEAARQLGLNYNSLKKKISRNTSYIKRLEE